MEELLPLDGVVTGFQVTGPYIDCMCGRELIKLEKQSGDILCRRAVFEKEGLSRDLIAQDGQIFLYDFCTLRAFRQEDFAPLGQWQLGDDLSSDICGIAADENTVFCSIRNGKIFALDRHSYAARECRAADSSMWSVQPWNGHLVCGTVDGRLLLLDQAALSVERTLVLGKKNIASLYFSRDSGLRTLVSRKVYLCGETLYAGSQDGKLFKISLQDFAVGGVAKNVHKKMFRCVGMYKDMLVTVSHPCSEIALWDQDTLERIKVIQIPLRLSGRAYVEDGFIYIASRNIMGIRRIELDQQ